MSEDESGEIWDDEDIICLRTRKPDVCNGCTRPDIAYAIGVVSRFMSNPDKEHCVAVKGILLYMRGTSSLCP